MRGPTPVLANACHEMEKNCHLVVTPENSILVIIQGNIACYHTEITVTF